LRLKFYFDENVDVSVAKGLSSRGIDTLTTQEAGLIGATDIQQIEFAIKSKRTFITHNKKDFIIIHQQLIAKNKVHYGIILSDHLPVGEFIKALSKLWYNIPQGKLINKIEFLGKWKSM